MLVQSRWRAQFHIANSTVELLGSLVPSDVVPLPPCYIRDLRLSLGGRVSIDTVKVGRCADLLGMDEARFIFRRKPQSLWPSSGQIPITIVGRYVPDLAYTRDP
jgi:hypothetical protein